MEIYNFVIELTRRCNMTCPHCLRGELQKISQKREYLAELFSRVRYISTLTLTGGEPSIVPHIIEMVIDIAQGYNVEIGSFYIATNGKRITPKFVEAVDRLHWYCTDNEMSRVDISNDIHHEEPIWTQAYEDLLDREFAGKKWEQTRDGFYSGRNFRDGRWTYAMGGIIEQGRGGDWVAADRQLSLDTIEVEADDEGNERVIEGTLYLNCKGWIINGCDWSFETQDDKDFEGRICHVRDFSFDRLRQYRYTKELQEA